MHIKNQTKHLHGRPKMTFSSWAIFSFSHRNDANSRVKSQKFTTAKFIQETVKPINVEFRIPYMKY